jgi:hypothetical protein
MQFLTRSDLAERWKTSARTIDRKRKDGLLPWVDIAGGSGSRPLVRFRLPEIEEYEERMSQRISQTKG